MNLLRYVLIAVICASSASASADERERATSPSESERHVDTHAAPAETHVYEGGGVTVEYSEGVAISERVVNAPEGPATLVEFVEADPRTGVVPANPARVTVIAFDNPLDVPGASGTNALAAVEQIVTSIQRALSGNETSDARAYSPEIFGEATEGMKLTITGDDGVRTVTVAGMARDGAGPLVVVLDTPGTEPSERFAALLRSMSLAD